MIVLGLTDSKPSTAAVLVDGVIAAAISEERLCRMKMAYGMPLQAIAAVIEAAKISAKDIDRVAVAQHALVFEPEPKAWDGWFHEGNARSKKKAFTQRVGSALAPALGNMPVAWQAYHGLKRTLTSDRRSKLPAVLRERFGINASAQFYDHHLCHATSAYYTSNLDHSLVVTLDGGGDGRSGSIYAAEEGRLRPVASVDSFNSLGNFYSYITALCGFKAENHEGKVTGLAALGKPVYADILRQFIRYEEPGQIRYTVPMYHQSALRIIAAKLPPGFDRADLASSVQVVLEEIGTAFIRYWLRKTGLRQVVVAGGVFSNVKFNQRIHELEECDRFFVHPAMDDSGLAVGAAFADLAAQPAINPSTLVRRLPNVYFGPEYSDAEIEQAISRAGYTSERSENIHQTIAKLLADGHVVARFTGRMEYGPRALGHRSIMYQTTDASINDWLNQNLNRTEFMPFAPATLVEHAHECFVGIQGAEDPARFMTITFDCTETMRKTSPGVVHVDGTARPQLIDPLSAPDFHAILDAYYRLTDIPSLINTSFNMHGEPIVCSPDDALRSFKQGKLDFLAIGNWLVSNTGVAGHINQTASKRQS
jgi:carbamoyltransferase